MKVLTQPYLFFLCVAEVHARHQDGEEDIRNILGPHQEDAGTELFHRLDRSHGKDDIRKRSQGRLLIRRDQQERIAAQLQEMRDVDEHAVLARAADEEAHMFLRRAVACRYCIVIAVWTVEHLLAMMKLEAAMLAISRLLSIA